MENLKSSKIISIQGNGTFETQHGLFYNYDMKMENGDSGDYISKNYTTIESLPFTNGSEIDYEFYPHDKFPKIKRPTISGAKRFDPNQKTSKSSYKNNDPDVQMMIVRQSSLQRSVEVLTHNNQKVKLNDVITLAEKISEWVMSETKLDVLKAKPQPDGNWSGDSKKNEPVPVNMHKPSPVLSYEKDATYNSGDDLPF